MFSSFFPIIKDIINTWEKKGKVKIAATTVPAIFTASETYDVGMDLGSASSNGISR